MKKSTVLKIRRIISPDDEVIRASVKEDINGDLVLIKDDEGMFFVSALPSTEMSYEMGTEMASIFDSNGLSLSSYNSLSCSVIKCKETNEYVAIAFFDSCDVSEIYEIISFFQKLYNGCENMIDRNKSETLYHSYKVDGNLNSLAHQPVCLGAKGYKENTIRGIYKGVNNDDFIYEFLIKYLKENVDKIKFDFVLDALNSFGEVNSTVVNAMALCEVLSNSIKTKQQEK